MKKFLLIVVPILCLAFGAIISGMKGSLNELFIEGRFSQKAEIGDIVYAENNLGFVLEQKSSKNCINYIKDGLVIGECVWLSGGEKMLNFIGDKLGLFVLDKYYVGDRLIVEGVSARLKYYIEGRRANVQISVDNEGDITVASPIIYGSF